MKVESQELAFIQEGNNGCGGGTNLVGSNEKLERERERLREDKIYRYQKSCI